MKNLKNAVAGMFLIASAAAHAQQLPQLPQFQAGTPAKAADVNANFETLRGAANATDGRVTTLEGVNAASRITALEAQLAASVACPVNTPTRFTDKGDGTVCDSQTGLMWEIKTGTTPGAPVACATPTDCPDAHHVNNEYTWSVPGSTEPTGTLYSNFLERLNDLKTPNDGTATPCFAGHCDWRMPTIGELLSILQAPFPNCTSPCIAAGFPGPVQAAVYWSSSSFAGGAGGAWMVNFSTGFASGLGDKTSDRPARAVRGGR